MVKINELRGSNMDTLKSLCGDKYEIYLINITEQTADIESGERYNNITNIYSNPKKGWYIQYLSDDAYGKFNRCPICGSYECTCEYEGKKEKEITDEEVFKLICDNYDTVQIVYMPKDRESSLNPKLFYPNNLETIEPF